jgi:hypothetical protein
MQSDLHVWVNGRATCLEQSDSFYMGMLLEDIHCVFNVNCVRNNEVREQKIYSITILFILDNNNNIYY